MATSRIAPSGTGPLPTPALNRAGAGRLVAVIGSTLIVGAVFFVAAGTTNVERGWVYYGGVLAYLLASVVAMMTSFPEVAEVVNERGRPLKADVKAWDKVFGVLYTLLLLAQPAIAGLDSVRWRWSQVPHSLALPALAVTLAGYALAQWAIVANRHAETGVRIQTDRHHEVVTTGPYRYVRHPLYAALLVIEVAYPAAIGSLYALAPSLAIMGLVVWRTAWEDLTLRRELRGYAEYAEHVRHRLVPHLW